MVKRLLFVCLGNICWSPAAEAVFLHLINSKGLAKDFEVDSAGTGGWHVGRPADSRMLMAANRRGIEIRSLARRIDVEDFREFDLILTMDQDNYDAVQALSKKAGTASTATIKPILSYLSKGELLEVPDPYYGGEDGFEKVLDLLEDACKELIVELSSS